jgi:hypothetical protein
MISTHGYLKIFAPLVLVVFISSVIVAPVFGQDNPDFTSSAPSTVNKGDTFDLKISPAKGSLDQKDVSLVLPGGFEIAAPSPSVLPDGSLDYKIIAAPDEGEGDIMIQINSPSGIQNLSQKISVQKSFYETAQPYLITIGVLVLIALAVGGMSRSGGGSGGSIY